jgi:hypothetical protein
VSEALGIVEEDTLGIACATRGCCNFIADFYVAVKLVVKVGVERPRMKETAIR